MKSRSTYLCAVGVTLVACSVVAIAGCGDRGSDFDAIQDGFKELRGPYSVDYSYRGGLFSGPEYLEGKISDSRGNVVPFCVLRTTNKSVPDACRALGTESRCHGFTIHTLDPGRPAADTRATWKAKILLGHKIETIVYGSTPGPGCNG